MTEHTSTNAQAEASKPENRAFRMHPALLWSVIQSQAGTPEKALLEAIMNAVDAGATRCEISLDEQGYRVVDDGTGFSDRSQIEEFFETFGTPHTEGDATYGKFRMGRGQLFAFSKTQWRSATFSMNVDIKGKGLSYDLHCDLDPVPGCSITGQWYETADLAEVIRIRHDLAQLAQWMQIDVWVNGKQINKRPEDHEWTIETPDAYIASKSAGGLAVYNMGALVRVYPPHQFGLSGLIVTKTRLQVNFARNDILLSECAVWKRLRRELDKLCGNLTKKRALEDFERDAIARRFIRGETSIGDIMGVSLVMDASGRRRTLNELSNAERICAAPSHREWHTGERVMDQGLAFVVRAQTLDRFGVETADELLTLLRNAANVRPGDAARLEDIHQEVIALRSRSEPCDRFDRMQALDKESKLILRDYPCRARFDHIKAVALSDVAKHINDRYDLLKMETLAPQQVAMAKGLQAASEFIAKHMTRYRLGMVPNAERFHDPNRPVFDYERPKYRLANQVTVRKVMIGKSDVAEAWTDGETYVAVDIEFVNKVLRGNRALSSITAVMYHEYCHNESDAGGHVHGPDFFELFHELACEGDGFEGARTVLLSTYAKAIADLGKKTNATMARALKADHKAGKTIGDDAAVPAAGTATLQ